MDDTGLDISASSPTPLAQAAPAKPQPPAGTAKVTLPIRAAGLPIGVEPEGGRSAIRALERVGQRVEQPCKHERQRLERLDRPLEVHRADEAWGPGSRHERRGVGAAREPLQLHAVLPHPLE